MNLFQKYLAEEFVEDYAEGRLSRREALKLIVSVTGSAVVATGLLAACAPKPTAATATPGGGAATLAASPSVPPPTAPPAVPSATSPAVSSGTAVASPAATSAATTTAPAATAEASASPVLSLGGTVSPDDPAISAQAVEFPGADGATLLGYLARPTGEGPFAVILVCHENRGLTEHIQDVARRLAKAGYVALAVDLLSRLGGTAAVGSDAVPGALGNISPDQFVQDFRSGWLYLGDQPGAQTQRVGMVGFCFGGGVTWQVAVHMPELKAAVPFYGPAPLVEDVPSIQAPVLAIYAGNDTRINSGIPAIEAAMQANGKVYQKIIYPNVDHAFHNDTSSRYNAEAARAAWAETLAWFAKYLAA